MRKRMIAFGLVLALGLMTFAGCGSKADQGQEHSPAGDNGGILGFGEKKEADFKSKPTKEIEEANFNDFKFQVDDVVFEARTATVEDFMKQFPSDKYYLAQYNTSGGAYDEVAMDRLQEVNGVGESFYIVNKEIYATDTFRNGTFGLCIVVENPNEAVTELKDCVVTNFELNRDYVGSIYAPKGIPLYDNELIQSDERFSYENINETFAGYGLEIVDAETYDYLGRDEVQYAGKQLLVPGKDGLSYRVIGYDSNVTELTISPAMFWVSFTIDPDTKMCSQTEYYFSGDVEGFAW